MFIAHRHGCDAVQESRNSFQLAATAMRTAEGALTSDQVTGSVSRRGGEMTLERRWRRRSPGIWSVEGPRVVDLKRYEQSEGQSDIEHVAVRARG